MKFLNIILYNVNCTIKIVFLQECELEGSLISSDIRIVEPFFYRNMFKEENNDLFVKTEFSDRSYKYNRYKLEKKYKDMFIKEDYCLLFSYMNFNMYFGKDKKDELGFYDSGEVLEELKSYCGCESQCEYDELMNFFKKHENGLKIHQEDLENFVDQKSFFKIDLRSFIIDDLSHNLFVGCEITISLVFYNSNWVQHFTPPIKIKSGSNSQLLFEPGNYKQNLEFFQHFFSRYRINLQNFKDIEKITVKVKKNEDKVERNEYEIEKIEDEVIKNECKVENNEIEVEKKEDEVEKNEDEKKKQQKMFLCIFTFIIISFLCTYIIYKYLHGYKNVRK